MVLRTFIDKSNTIIEDCNNNFGLNPISMLHYGDLISRFLIHFDETRIKECFLNKDFSDISNVTHTLKMTNCGSVDNDNFYKKIVGFNGTGERVRTSSFDIIIFEASKSWDSGVGFDSSLDYWLTGKNAVSTNGSTWYKRSNEKKWKEEGVISREVLKVEYDKFLNGEESIIVGTQHFDYGNENLEIDITKYVNDIIFNNKKNNGLCIAFTPYLEEEKINDVQYVGFFNNNTNTFFMPCVESVDNEKIVDNRFSFIINNENRLYLFTQINGELSNLDILPTCTINNIEYPVKQAKKGVYYAVVKLDKTQCEVNSILYDVWSNIIFNGIVFDDVEMEFVVHSPNEFYNFGEYKDYLNKYSATIQGINDSEYLVVGEKREVSVIYKKDYTYNDYKLLSDSQYRIYIKDNNRDIDVIKWHNIDLMSDKNTFILNTENLLPNTYYIDIKCKINNEIRIYEEVVKFNIKNNKTNQKH